MSHDIRTFSTPVQEAVLASLQDTIKLQAALLARFEARELNMREMMERRAGEFGAEIGRLDSRVQGVVARASGQIAVDAKADLAPVLNEYRQMAAHSAVQLRAVSKVAWWSIAGATALLGLALVAGWGLAGHYRGEVRDAREQLHRYEDALPVLEAFYASDAIVCNQRVCVNVEPGARGQGTNRQYRPAKSRPRH